MQSKGDENEITKGRAGEEGNYVDDEEKSRQCKYENIMTKWVRQMPGAMDSSLANAIFFSLHSIL